MRDPVDTSGRAYLHSSVGRAEDSASAAQVQVLSTLNIIARFAKLFATGQPNPGVDRAAAFSNSVRGHCAGPHALGWSPEYVRRPDGDLDWVRETGTLCSVP